MWYDEFMATNDSNSSNSKKGKRNGGKTRAHRVGDSSLRETVEAVLTLLGGLAVIGPILFSLLFAGILPALGFDGAARFAHTVFQVLFPVGIAFLVILGVVALATRVPLVGRLAGAAVLLSIFGGLLSVAGIGSNLGIGNVWSALNRADHERRIEYVSNLTEIDEERPSYDERTALDQAEFQIRRSLAGVVGDFSAPTRVGEEWCSYISTAAEIRNRWTESVVCVDDDGLVRRASFPVSTVPSVGLGFRNSEIRNVVAAVAGSDALLSNDDIYGYIAEVDGEEVPRLVVPIGDRRGLDLSKPVLPDGAVVFGVNDDGNYEVVVLDDVEAGAHPGPVAGLAIAELIRESLNDSYGFLVSERPSRSPLSVQGTVEVGGDETDESEVEIDESDPNFSNPTEFVLSRDGVPYAVTPLTSFGSASTITAYLEVRLDTVVNGEAPEATLYRLPEPEAANTTLENTIRVLYGQDLAEADRIYEVTPAESGISRITIGREDQVRFVARSETNIASGELTGEICVESRTGLDLDCSQLREDPRPLGTLVRANGAPGSQSDDAPVGSLQDVPLEDLLAEIERRVNQ